jgi:hypothetical protein
LRDVLDATRPLKERRDTTVTGVQKIEAIKIILQALEVIKDKKI